MPIADSVLPRSALDTAIVSMRLHHDNKILKVSNIAQKSGLFEFYKAEMDGQAHDNPGESYIVSAGEFYPDPVAPVKRCATPHLIALWQADGFNSRAAPFVVIEMDHSGEQQRRSQRHTWRTYMTNLDEAYLEKSRIINADVSLRRSFPLRLARSLRAMASALASRDGVSLNYFISHAVAEKINRLEHEKVAPEAQGRQSPPFASR